MSEAALAEIPARKMCSVSGCDIPLRSDNESGLCKQHKTGKGERAANQRVCSSPGCGRELGAANKSGVCSVCQGSYKPGGESKASPRVKPPPKTGKEEDFGAIAERFRAVAGGLGLNPDEILAEHMSGWLEQLRERLAEPPKKRGPRKPVDDEYSLRGDNDD